MATNHHPSPSARPSARALAERVAPVAAALMLASALRCRTRPITRLVSFGALIALWTVAYGRYRRGGISSTARERELLKSATWETFTRHYNEDVPTIEEEFDIWGAYHQHRHEMRYDLVAEQVRAVLRPGSRILDVGCGSVLVADRLLDQNAFYVGVEFGGHQLKYGAEKLRENHHRLRSGLGQADAARLPFTDESFDVVVMSEVIEHLLRPEDAVWEIARVLRPGGTFVMTTNNASEVPLRTPLTHLFAWIEKGLGANRPELISYRPWVWPEPIGVTKDSSEKVYLPHTHHIQAETRAMFAAAGLETVHWSTFEFPPPQSATAAWLDRPGDAGRRAVDLIESVAQRTPFVRRLGCHLFMVATKTGTLVAPSPPAGVWPGPFSESEAVNQ